METNFDLIVIGGGPAGYVAAIKAGQMGDKVACIDAWLNGDKPAFGGTCLNAGCIPSKALLESSELYHRAQHELSTHGIIGGEIGLDLGKMQARKTNICTQLTGGIAQLFKANNVTGLFGYGTLIAANNEGCQVEYNAHSGEKNTLNAKRVILASGSEPVELPMAKYNGENIVDSWGALEFTEVPKTLGIIGAGVIGMELGSVWQRLGSQVVILEAMDEFLPMVDTQIAKSALTQFKKQGLDIRLGAKVSNTKLLETNNQIQVSYTQNNAEQNIVFDKLVVAVGRRPVVKKAVNPELNLAVNVRGFIEVNANYQTNLPNVYAVGDVIGGAMLAHKGMEEGVACVEIMHGHKAQLNYDAVPSIIYTQPELAWVGLSEAQAKAKGFNVKVGAFPFAAVGRAKAMENTAGMVKIISDVASDRVLGAHLTGPFVSELLAELVLALEFGATTEDLQLTMHAHPALAEAVHEAALAVDGKAIHAINRKR